MAAASMLLVSCVLSREGLGVGPSVGGGGSANNSAGGAGLAGMSAGGSDAGGSGGMGGAAAAGGGVSAGGSGGKGGGGATPIVFNSWEVVIDAAGARVAAGGHIAAVELFQSVSLTDLSSEIAFDHFHAGPHPGAFNRVESYWAYNTNANTYPYVGKSTIDRGSDSGETDAPMPLGVRDLQMHPPNLNKLVVMAFVAPIEADYTASNLAVRRVHDLGALASMVLHYPCTAASLASLQASNDRAWVTSAQSYALGKLSAGDRICVGVSRDDDYGWDAVEIAWTLTAQP